MDVLKDSLGNVINVGDEVVSLSNIGINWEIHLNKKYRVRRIDTIRKKILVVNEVYDVEWYNINVFRKYVEGYRRETIDEILS